MEGIPLVLFGSVVQQGNPWVLHTQHTLGVELTEVGILEQVFLLTLGVGTRVQVDKAVATSPRLGNRQDTGQPRPGNPLDPANDEDSGSQHGPGITSGEEGVRFPVFNGGSGLHD